MKRLLKEWREVLGDDSIGDDERAEKIDSAWQEFDCGLNGPSCKSGCDCSSGQKVSVGG